MFEDIKIILVNPEFGANVGAVCRAMKTMGFSKLVIAGEEKFDIERVKTLAVHAFDVFQERDHVLTLKEALGSAVFTAGITRRQGRFRKYLNLLPEDLAEHIRSIGKGSSALVFGNEEHGLTDEELKLCDAAVTIPSSEAFPSLNLSHAVQVITYVIRRSSLSSREYNPVSRQKMEDLIQHITGSLESIGFYRLTGKEEMGIYFRDIFSRAHLEENEARRMKSIFKKIEGLARLRGNI